VRHAVDDVSFSIAPGEIVGLVGESGSGKSTIARVLTAMQPATHGDVRYKGSPLSGMNRRELRAYRTHVQMVFQNPAGSLNPRMRIGDAISEAVRVRDGLTGRQARLLACDALEKVGLLPEWHDRYPNAFSGGQRQRIVIARALSLSPKVLICDEPVSALDVSVQAQILELIVRLRATLGLACLFISHDLDVIRHVSDRVAVLYRGKLVEIGETRRVLTQPQHDYTRTLLASTPIPKWLRG
jgi:ABC-type glutathione transport system ATPase component